MMTMENSDNTISDEAAPDTKSGFFAVDRQVWEVACDLGLREAVAYLVLARGSGGDNRTTSWSVHAIEEHTGIGRTRAKKALQNLIQKGLVRQDKGGTKPRYYLLPAHEVPGCKDYELAGTLNMSREEREALQPGWIWLPNTLVDGVGDVFAPIKQIRRTQKLAVLRLFIRLYDAHAFTDDGGINWRSGGIRQRYKRVRVGERSERIIWGFQPQKVECDPNAPFAALGAAFWSAWETLTATGLVEMVPHLIEADSDDAEIMHPVPFDWRGEALEHRVAVIHPLWSGPS